MPSRDLRTWIALLEAEGELKRVKAKVDWDGEISQIIKRVFMQEGPALLFENIKGHEATRSRRLFTNGLGTIARWNLMLGLPKDTSMSEIIKTIKERGKDPLEPVRVSSGPVKENIVKGEDVDLFQLPVPKWHSLDAGRYINTFYGAVVKDPDTGQNNVGIYRGMISSKNKIGVLLIPMKDWGILYSKYQQMGKPMPVAFVYGWDPVLPFTGCAAYTAGVSEYEIMGALRGKPVELVKCETIDLEVPATAEIVVEGLMPIEPESYKMEGPFGEFPGYYTGTTSLKPVTKINCITHRDNPIFQGTLEGRPPHEDSRCGSISMSGIAWDALERMGIPGITDVFCPAAVGNGTNVRVQINKRYNGHAKQISACIWAAGQTQFKNVLVVEEDIDIHDPDDLEWAFGYRVDPKEDLIVFPDKIRSTWWRKQGHSLAVEDLQDVLEFKPEVLVVGKGASGLMEIPAPTQNALQDEGIEVIAQNTSQACNTFNEQIEAGKKVVGAFHLTC